MNLRIKSPAYQEVKHTTPDDIRRSTFNYLVIGQNDELKKLSRMQKGMTGKDLYKRHYRVSVMNRSLTAIGIPILVWLILETFFR